MQDKSDLESQIQKEASVDLWFALKPAGQFLPPSPRHMLNNNAALISAICQKPVSINAKYVLPINGRTRSGSFWSSILEALMKAAISI